MTSKSKSARKRASSKHVRQMALRKQTEYAIKVWYEARVMYGRPRYEPVRKREVEVEIPEDYLRGLDLLAEARAARPRNWRSRVVRPVLDEQGEPKRDNKGNVIVETLSIYDALTANGRDTLVKRRTQAPRGVSMDTEVVGPRQPVIREKDPLGLVQATIMRVGLIHEPAMHALEMWAAGYSRRKMAEQLGLKDKNMATTCFEIGINIVQFALLVDPIYTSTNHNRRKVLLEDLFPNKEFSE